jgi:pimeloyl-ACP methyl ester carboxylesterase
VRHWTESYGGNGLTLNIHRFRSDEADERRGTVVLLHGFMDCGASWDLVAAPLCQHGYDLWAPDMRGFGDSDRVRGGGYYHFPDYVADLDAIAREAGWSRISLVGHSMGGTIASLFTTARPDLIDRVALLEGLGPPHMPPELAPTRLRRWLDNLATPRTPRLPATFDEACERLAFYHPRVTPEVLRTRAEMLTIARDDGSLAWRHDPLHRTTSPSLFNAEAFGACLATIECPVMFLSGGPAGWHPNDEEQRLAALPRPPQRVELPEAGHMMHWTEPQAVADALEAFFGGSG